MPRTLPNTDTAAFAVFTVDRVSAGFPADNPVRAIKKAGVALSTSAARKTALRFNGIG